MDKRARFAVSTAAVGAGLVALFSVPTQWFVAGTFAVTTVMMAGAVWAGGLRPRFKLDIRKVSIGLASSVVLYGIFLAGNYAIRAIAIPGVNPSGESPVYSLIASPSNPVLLQVAILLFDALGYEAFFRGTLQASLKPRLGAGAAPAVAAFDAALHIATLNPLWVSTTFIADTVWGLTYHFGKGAQSSGVSHFVWDVAIFILAPIK